MTPEQIEQSLRELLTRGGNDATSKATPSSEVDQDSVELEIKTAARELAKLSPERLQRVFRLLRA